MLPWPHADRWRPVPDAEPNTRTIKFPAVYRDVSVLATAIARHDQIDIVPAPGVVLEIPLEVWQTIAPFLTAAALVRRPD